MFENIGISPCFGAKNTFPVLVSSLYPGQINGLKIIFQHWHLFQVITSIHIPKKGVRGTKENDRNRFWLKQLCVFQLIVWTGFQESSICENISVRGGAAGYVLSRQLCKNINENIVETEVRFFHAVTLQYKWKYKGTCQKLLSGFFPLRGGVPPHPFRQAFLGTMAFR